MLDKEGKFPKDFWPARCRLREEATNRGSRRRLVKFFDDSLHIPGSGTKAPDNKYERVCVRDVSRIRYLETSFSRRYEDGKL